MRQQSGSAIALRETSVWVNDGYTTVRECRSAEEVQKCDRACR
ncbi:hypothetical protein Q5691_04765 [Microcoleus sp. w1-18aA5]